MSTEELKQPPGGANSAPSTAPQAPSPSALPQQSEQRATTLDSALVFGLISLFVSLFLWYALTVGSDSQFADWAILFALIGVSVADLFTGGAMALLARQFVDRGPRRLAALGSICLLGALLPFFRPPNFFPTFAWIHVTAVLTTAGGALSLSASIWAKTTSNRLRAGTKA